MTKQYGYTEPGSDYPQYINVQHVSGPTGAEDTLRITVRGRKGEDGSCGATVSMDLSRREAAKLREAMLDVMQP